jgi:hypothetical protein
MCELFSAEDHHPLADAPFPIPFDSEIGPVCIRVRLVASVANATTGPQAAMAGA